MAIAAPILPRAKTQIRPMTRDAGSTPARTWECHRSTSTTKPNFVYDNRIVETDTRSLAAPVHFVKEGDTQAVGLQWRSENYLKA